MKHSEWIRPAQEDLDQFDGIENPQDDGSPPLFLSIGATLSCLGGIPLARAAGHGPTGAACGVLSATAFMASAYFFNKPYPRLESDLLAGHGIGFTTGLLLLPAQAVLWRRNPAAIFAPLHMGGVGAISVVFHGWRLLQLDSKTASQQNRT